MKSYRCLKILCLLILSAALFFRPQPVPAVETAPKITDREIVERLTSMEASL